MLISRSPARGPEPIQRRSLAILYRLTATVRSWPDVSTSASWAPCASKWSRASVSGRPVVSASTAIVRSRKARRHVDAGAYGGPAERQLRQPWQGVPSRSMPARTWAA